MNITIAIERLIFDGIAIPQRHRAEVQNACEAELTRLLAVDGLSFQTSGRQQTVLGGVLGIKHDETPQMLGKKLALAIYKGLVNERIGNDTSKTSNGKTCTQ